MFEITNQYHIHINYSVHVLSVFENQQKNRSFLKCNVEHRSIMDMQTRFWSLTLHAVAGPKANLSLVSKCSVGWICCENKTSFQRIVIFQVWYGSKRGYHRNWTVDTEHAQHSNTGMAGSTLHHYIRHEAEMGVFFQSTGYPSWPCRLARAAGLGRISATEGNLWKGYQHRTN